ncbi:MAG: enoyl-CoA hydratase [Betaproteobacteria bacterium RIFCSPLOWO2_02_FULL_67_26]|nr:MAG: enoyl-CoA hydratase [Betaproteobacteria bacterium RIFCSPLOWO2_02_FULL_67_26]
MSDPARIPDLRDAALELEGRVALLTLKRDDKRNALTGTALVDDICATLEWVNATAEVSALILTGAGSAFSAGGDIKTMRSRAMASTAAEMERYYRHGIQRIPRAMKAVEVPVIAAVNGPAIGAGFDLANMCDIRIGSTNAQFGETFVNLGLMSGDGGAWFLQRVVGVQRAAELTFTGRIVKAEEARALGILLEVTEPERLLPRAREIGAQIAAKPPLAVRYAKRTLRLAQFQSVDEHLEACASFQGALQKTDDHLEAVTAFIEKRRGSFKGR